MSALKPGVGTLWRLLDRDPHQRVYIACRVAIAVVVDNTGEEVALLCVAVKAQLAGKIFKST